MPPPSESAWYASCNGSRGRRTGRARRWTKPTWKRTSWNGRARVEAQPRAVGRVSPACASSAPWLYCFSLPTCLPSSPAKASMPGTRTKTVELVREEIPERIRGRLRSGSIADRDGFIGRQEDAAAFHKGRGGQPGTRPAPRAIAGVKTIKNLDYAGTGNPRRMLDVYLPEKPASSAPLPVACWIHGGAWRAGDRANGSQDGPTGRHSGRYAGISIGYRLDRRSHLARADFAIARRPSARFAPHASEHGLGPNRIAVWGSSAGGRLAFSMLGVSGGVKELEGETGPDLDPILDGPMRRRFLRPHRAPRRGRSGQSNGPLHAATCRRPSHRRRDQGCAG